MGPNPRRWRVTIILAVLGLAVAGAALWLWQRRPPNRPHAGPESRPLQRTQVQTAVAALSDRTSLHVAVLTHYVNRLANTQGTRLFFIRLPDGTDPPPAMLQQLQTSAITVKGASECERTRDAAGQVVHKHTRKPGVLVIIGPCKVNNQKAVVHVGYDMFSLGAGSCTYEMEYRGNDWLVTKVEGGPQI